ncbi:hypothetical protein LCGC14_2911820, partial [marine sediment metagenome]
MNFGQPYPCPECCPRDTPCPCGNCGGDDPPCCWKVVITGMVDGTGSDCTCHDDTYKVPFQSACTWFLAATALYVSSDLTVTVYLEGGNYKIKVALGSHEWIKNYGGTKPQCQDLADESITHSSSPADCDSSSATCVITALPAGSDCPNRLFGCAHCDPCRRTPQEFQVQMTGLTNGTCGDCSDLNDTYILTSQGPFVPCDYRYFL